MPWEAAHQHWAKAEPMRLAYYVNPDVLRWFEGAINYDDLLGTPQGKAQIVEAIYTSLCQRKLPINYAPEKFDYREAFQPIRHPEEVLGDRSPMGTCLDLSLVFCGLCLAHNLLPILIILDGHALVAVALDKSLPEWNGYRKGRNLFERDAIWERGLLTAQQPEQLTQFKQLVEDEVFLAIECTGFAHSARLGREASLFPEGIDRQEDGTLTFERAKQAGREQLEQRERPFQFALDIAIAQAYTGRPYALTDEPWINLDAAEVIYRQQVIAAYNRLNFTGFEKSDERLLKDVPLEEIFVRLSLSVKTVKTVEPEPEKTRQINKSEQRKSRQQERVERVVQEPIELSQALRHQLLLVGEPGAGKSTLLHWLAVTFAQKRQRNPDRLGPSADADRLPVLVEFTSLPSVYLKPRDKGGKTPNWIQFLPEYITDQMAFTTVSPQLLVQALSEGRCLLLFDGLDEVTDPDVRTSLASSIADFARFAHPGNRVIIGSRPAGVSKSEEALGPQFRRCQIEPFTPEDVQQFFHFWYALDHKLTPEQQQREAESLYAEVHATTKVLQLATTPLLSTMLVLIWRNEGYLPERRVDLYQRCCRDLIEHWERHHGVASQEKLKSLDWEQHLRLLEPLAYFIHSHSQEQRASASRADLIPLLAQSLKDQKISTNADQAVELAKQFLESLGLRSGLLQFLGSDHFGFPHLTFQEYLAARYIVSQPCPEEIDPGSGVPTYIDLVMEHLHETWWREVHLLAIGHLGSGRTGAKKASALILSILNAYAPPLWILRTSDNRLLRRIGLGKFLPKFQIERRVAWMLGREFELAANAYVECAQEGRAPAVDAALSGRAVQLARDIVYDLDRLGAQDNLLIETYQWLQDEEKERVVAALLEFLHKRVPGEGQSQIAAAKCLVRMEIGNEKVMNALLQVLKEQGLWVRIAVPEVLKLVGNGNEKVVIALLEALEVLYYHSEHENYRMRRAVVESLGQVGSENEMGVAALLLSLLHEDRGVRNAAAEALGLMGIGKEKVVNALLQVLEMPHDNSENYEVRSAAAASLGLVGSGDERVVNPLLQVLEGRDYDAEDQSWKMRAAGLEWLTGGKFQKIVNFVAKVTEEPHYHEDYRVRREAAASLGRMGSGNERVVNALLKALKDKQELVRRGAAEALGLVGSGNERVVDALIHRLNSIFFSERETYVQSGLVESLGLVGSGNERVVDALLKALSRDRTDSAVRREAAEALGLVGSGNEKVVDALLEALKDTEDWVRREAVESLGRLGSGNEKVVDTLLDLLDDKDGRIRSAAVKSLGLVKIKSSIHLLKIFCRLLHDRDNRVREAALTSCYQLLDGHSLPSYRWVPSRK